VRNQLGSRPKQHQVFGNDHPVLRGLITARTRAGRTLGFLYHNFTCRGAGVGWRRTARAGRYCLGAGTKTLCSGQTGGTYTLEKHGEPAAVFGRDDRGSAMNLIDTQKRRRAMGRAYLAESLTRALPVPTARPPNERDAQIHSR